MIIDRVQFLQQIGFAGKDMETGELITSFFDQHMILYNMICDKRCTVSNVFVEENKGYFYFQVDFESEEDTYMEFPNRVQLYSKEYCICTQRISPTSLFFVMNVTMDYWNK